MPTSASPRADVPESEVFDIFLFLVFQSVIPAPLGMEDATRSVSSPTSDSEVSRPLSLSASAVTDISWGKTEKLVHLLYAFPFFSMEKHSRGPYLDFRFMEMRKQEGNIKLLDL